VASTPQNQSLPLYQSFSARQPADSGALADLLTRCRARDPEFVSSVRDGQHRVWARTPSEMARRVAEVTGTASFPVDVGPPTVQPCWTPGRVGEAEHRLGDADGRAGAFAVVRLRIVPRSSGEGNIFETEFAGPPQIDAFNEAVGRGVATACSEGVGGEGRIIDTRTIFIDGAFHASRSTPAAFERAAAAAMHSACSAAMMRRLEPLVTIDIQIGRDHVLPVVNDIAASGGSEVRRRLAPAGVIVTVELPMRNFLLYGAHLATLTQGAGVLIGEPQLSRWAEVRRTERR
jgi:translation elongation factor EF-G